MIRTDGKVFNAVKEMLQEAGIDTSTLQVVSFGRGTYHDVVLGGDVVGAYEHNSKNLELYEEI